MRTTAVLFFTALLITLLAAPLPAAAAPQPSGEIDLASLDAYVAGQMDKHGLKGISLAVTRGDQVIYLKGYGQAGQGRPMTPQTPMYIGSQSKSITGLAVAQLAAQGKIDLAAPVRKYIPWFRVADPAASGTITVSDLLHHLSGLSDAGNHAILPDDASLEQGIRSLEAARHHGSGGD